MRALIGYTGFVGSALLRAGGYDALYNSANINQIRGREFDEIVCAGVYARKWWANQNPKEDWENIGRLLDEMDHSEYESLVLISTIDAIDPCDAYGANRQDLENILWRPNGVMTVRLPALFGPGLKKNALYDLMQGDETEKIPENAVYQWYPVDRIAAEIERAKEARIETLNLLSDPIGIAEIRDRFFPTAKLGPPRVGAPNYRIRSEHAGFQLSRAQVLAEMEEFLATGL